MGGARFASPMDPGARPGLPKLRLETLVDGTAAIVMTLLVLEIKVPDVPASELPAALLHLRTEMLAFFVSVAVVGAFWLGHNHHMNLITHANRPLVWINVAGLGIVAFIPFSTALLGHHGAEAIPTALYGANLAALGVVALLHWGYATRAGLVRADLPREASDDLLRRTLAGATLSAIGAGVAFVFPLLSLGLYALAFVPFALPGKYDRHLRARG